MFPPHTIGGAEIVAFRQARALAARGHAVVVLAGAASSQEIPAGTLNFDTYEGLPVYRLALRSLGPDLNFHWPAAAHRLRSVITSHDIEIVHFHNVVGLGANLIPAAKSAGRKCIVTLHDHWGFCFQQTRLRTDGSLCTNHEECAGCKKNVVPGDRIALPMRLRRDYVVWCLNQADQLVVPSGYLAYAYAQSGFPSSSISVLSNGIELDAVSAAAKVPSKDGVRFLWSGYLGEHKGIFVLLKALEILSRETELSGRWQVTIAGDGHLKTKVEAAIRNFASNVRYVGRLSRVELLELLSKTDVSMLTSIWPENESVTMLEAIASGTAQIATRIGGNVGLVDHTNSGFLITPNDAADLADAMRRYILDHALAERHGSRNRERRKDFDEHTTINKLDAIYSSRQDLDPATRSQEPVVICGTEWPAPEVAMLMNRVHDHLMPGLTPRFIWRDWGHGAAWNHAALIWLWDRHPSEPLVNEALRRGVPVLAPMTDWAIGLSRHYDGVMLYRTYLEALAALRALFSITTLRTEFSWHARAAANAATAMARSETFNLRSETVS
jgi:glycosyltransferase involved in cell wall biosynthesis